MARTDHNTADRENLITTGNDAQADKEDEESPDSASEENTGEDMETEAMPDKD